MQVSFNPYNTSRATSFRALTQKQFDMYTMEPEMATKLETLVKTDKAIKLDDADVKKLTAFFHEWKNGKGSKKFAAVIVGRMLGLK